MATRVLHTSDVHGEQDRVLALLSDPGFDVWVDSGDFMPDRWREGPAINIPRQVRWWPEKALARRIREALGERPAVICYGNHDHFEWADLIGARHVMADALVVAAGLSFAGFAETPIIAPGFFPRQVDAEAQRRLADQACSLQPDVLVTHAPPDGPLARGEGWGIAGLHAALRRSARTTVHLYGHIHEMANAGLEVDGVRFFNSARRHNQLSVEPVAR